MSKQSEKLLREALTLSEEERAHLAAALLASMDGPADPDADEAWSEEIARRAESVESGADHGEAWDVVRTRIQAKLKR